MTLVSTSVPQFRPHVEQFTWQLSRRAGLQGVPCKFISDLDANHARLTALFHQKLREANRQETLAFESHQVTYPLFGSLAGASNILIPAMMPFPNPISISLLLTATVGASLIGAAFGYKSAKVTGEEAAFPFLQEALIEEQNWIHEAYNDLFEEINRLRIEPISEDSRIQLEQLIALQGHFDTILEISPERYRPIF